MFGDMNQRIALYRPRSATLRIGEPITIIKADSTSRASSATLADDPDLFCTLQPGQYAIEGMLMFQIGNTTGGLQYSMRFAGGSTSSVIANRFNTPNTSGSSTSTTSTFMQATFPTTTGTFNSSGGTTNYLGQVKFDIIVAVNAVGTYHFQWAQSVSNAAALQLLYGSWIRITRAG